MKPRALQGCLQPGRKLEWIKVPGLAHAFLWHVFPNVLPEVPKHWHLVAGNVFCYRNAGQLHDSTLDGIHEGEGAHRPRKERPFGVAGAAKEEWRS